MRDLGMSRLLGVTLPGDGGCLLQPDCASMGERMVM
jgi:hypothetical protein